MQLPLENTLFVDIVFVTRFQFRRFAVELRKEGAGLIDETPRPFSVAPLRRVASLHIPMSDGQQAFVVKYTSAFLPTVHEP